MPRLSDSDLKKLVEYFKILNSIYLENKEEIDKMTSQETIAIYSHGFGVLKDNRGMFTEIKEAFPDFHKHFLLDMNKFNKEKNELTVAPLDKQADLLARFVKRIQSDYPDYRIILFCHSQGCLVASMAKLQGIYRVYFLAPPSSISGAGNKIKEMLKREGTVKSEDGSIKYPRRDGSTTIVSREYLDSREGVNPIELYKDLAKNNRTVVIKAKDDEVLGETNLDQVNEFLDVIELPGNHDFNREYRPGLIKMLKNITL